MGSSKGVLIKSVVGPLLKVERFQDIAMALMPTMLPREGDSYEKSYFPFFPILPKDEAWK
jgi:hypothetical protein